MAQHNNKASRAFKLLVSIRNDIMDGVRAEARQTGDTITSIVNRALLERKRPDVPPPSPTAPPKPKAEYVAPPKGRTATFDDPHAGIKKRLREATQERARARSTLQSVGATLKAYNSAAFRDGRPQLSTTPEFDAARAAFDAAEEAVTVLEAELAGAMAKAESQEQAQPADT